MLLREHRREEHEHGADGAQRARQAAMTKAAALIDIARTEPRDKAVDGGKQIRRCVQQPDRPHGPARKAARFQRWADIVRRQQDEKQEADHLGRKIGRHKAIAQGAALLGHDGILIDPERERRDIDEDPDRRKRERAVEGRRHIVHGKAPTQDLQQLRATEGDEVHQARDGKRKAVFRRDDLMQESAQQATTSRTE